jgi:hypothetical protein
MAMVLDLCADFGHGRLRSMRIYFRPASPRHGGVVDRGYKCWRCGSMAVRASHPPQGDKLGWLVGFRAEAPSGRHFFPTWRCYPQHLHQMMHIG